MDYLIELDGVKTGFLAADSAREAVLKAQIVFPDADRVLAEACNPGSDNTIETAGRGAGRIAGMLSDLESGV